MSQRQPERTGTPVASQTMTATGTSQGSSNPPASAQPSLPTRTLRLRGAHNNSNGRSVQWADDVVDNEGLGRKSSKVCCIYHKPRAVGESSDESDSSSSGSDSDSDTEGAKPSRKPQRDDREHDCGHDHHHGHTHGGGRGGRSERKRRPSPNAYEKQPNYKPKEQPKGGSG